MFAQGCPLGPYVYHAEVDGVYDGDTVMVNIDLGFHTWRMGEKLRLHGIDAPEVRGKTRAEGLLSRDWLRSQVLGKRILVKTVKAGNRQRGKYGRYIAVLFVVEDGVCVNLNDELVRLGYAVLKVY